MSTNAGASEPVSEGSPEKVQIEITSEPSGADIFVDDVFVGSTRSSAEYGTRNAEFEEMPNVEFVLLATPEKCRRVGRASFKDWSRKLHVDPGILCPVA